MRKTSNPRRIPARSPGRPAIFIFPLAFPKAVDLSCKSNLYKPLRPRSPALPHSPHSTPLHSTPLSPSPDPHKKKQKARETSVPAMRRHGAANYELQGSPEGSVITENMSRAEQSSRGAEANRSPGFGTLGFATSAPLQLHSATPPSPDPPERGDVPSLSAPGNARTARTWPTWPCSLHVAACLSPGELGGACSWGYNPCCRAHVCFLGLWSPGPCMMQCWVRRLVE
jgi:hypothetical protein